MRKNYRFSHTKICALLGLVAVAAFVVFCERQGGRQKTGELVVVGGPQFESVFEDIARGFEKRNPSIRVVCKFTCPPCMLRKSSRPMPQGDLLVSTGKKDIEFFEQDGLIDPSKREVFANGELVLISKSGSSPAISSINDLAAPNVKKIAIGDPENVSPGYYAKQSFEKLKLWQKIESKIEFDSSGCLILRRVKLGEVDAGIVFKFCVNESDLVPGRIDVVEAIAKDNHEKIAFEMIPFRQSERADIAQRFVAFVKSEEGRRILSSHGLSPRK